MNSLFLYPKSSSGECYKSQFRLLPTLEVKASELKPLEIIISKDFTIGETLLGRPILNRTTKYNGKLYEKLLALNLPRDGRLNNKTKLQLLDFISMYGTPLGGPISLQGQLTGSDGEEINWAFIPYEINLKNGEFFSTFRNIYSDFVDTVEIIQSGNLDLLNNFRGTFDLGLEGNKLVLPPYPLNDFNRLPKWISYTCLNLCYLELYELLSSNQSIKTCKYCGNFYESSKRNELRCNNCKNPTIYRKLYYARNSEKERQTARERMKKLRLQEKQKQSKI